MFFQKLTFRYFCTKSSKQLDFFREIPPGPPTSNMRGLPGPQVPPRNPPPDGKSSTGSNDRLLSVSGKKKCSHCKEELGKIYKF